MQLQAEPQPGEPGYNQGMWRRGGKRPDEEGEAEKKEAASSRPSAVPEAAKRPIRSPMAASGRPRVVTKSGQQQRAARDEEEDERPQARATSFAEYRASAGGAGSGGGSGSASMGSASGTEKRSPAMQTRRSMLDSGSPFKLSKLPDYLQPLPEDTREQREKLRKRASSK